MAACAALSYQPLTHVTWWCPPCGCVQVVPGKALLQLASQRPDLALELGLRMSQGLKQQLGQLQAAQQVGSRGSPLLLCAHPQANINNFAVPLAPACSGGSELPQAALTLCDETSTAAACIPVLLRFDCGRCVSRMRVLRAMLCCAVCTACCRVRSGGHVPCNPTWCQHPSGGLLATANMLTGCGGR